MRCLALIAALLLLACLSPTATSAHEGHSVASSPDPPADLSAADQSAAQLSPSLPQPASNSDKDTVDKQKAQQKWNIEHGLGVPSSLPVADPQSSPLPVVPPVVHSKPLALSPITPPIPEQIVGGASREEKSEQEEQESPPAGTPFVIVIQPNVQIHMPEGSIPMQRPEQSESESEYEQRPEQSRPQSDQETEKGEEEQMDRPPSSLAAPLSLRQSAIKVALMRRKVMMLESKLSMLRSKLAGDSSLALPIARARRQLVKAKLALAIAERRHRLLRHQKLKEHEAKLMKLKLGQTAETTHFDTQAFDQQQLVSIPTFARVAAPVSVSVPVLSAPLASAAPSAIEPSTPIAIPTYSRVQAPILSVAQPIVQPVQPTFTTSIIQPTIQPTIQPVLSYAQPLTQPMTQSTLINVPIVRPIPPVALSYTPSATVSVLSEPQPQPTVQIAQPASFALPTVQQQPQTISTVQPVLSYVQPQLQQSFVAQPTAQPIMQAESSLTAVPSVSQAVAVPGPFEYLGPQAPLRPIDPANPPPPIVAMPAAPKLGVTLAPPNADQQTVAQIALGSGGLTQPAQLAAIQPAIQPALAYGQPQLQQPFVAQPGMANVPSIEQTGALGSIGSFGSIGLNQQQQHWGQMPSVALGAAVGQQLQQMDPQQLAQQQQISQQQGQIAQQPQQWAADQFAQPIGQPQQMAA